MQKEKHEHVHSELRTREQCSYPSYCCTQLTLDGFKYCGRHILQEKTSPYKPCSYVFNSNGKHCHLPALGDKKDGYCNKHALKLHLNTSKRNNPCQPPRTAEVLLNYVSHYIKRPNSSTQQSDEGRAVTPDEIEGSVTKSLDPFVDIDVRSVLATGHNVLDMCSESESDVEPTVYGSVWHDTHAESSDHDSIDSENEDGFKHADIYSAEEATLITRNKLKRLQNLYLDQYRYLQHMLREHRRRYLFALKHEKETCCNIYNQVHENPKEQRLYKKLKGYNSYHSKHGSDAICLKRLHERRLKITEGYISKQQSYTKCIFTEGGVKCGEKTLPVTRHCPKHILEDPNQILFRVCGKMCGDIECRTPVESIFDQVTCRLHTDFPPVHTYNQARKDSESDHDEIGTQIGHIDESSPILQRPDDMKTEDSFFPNMNLESETLEHTDDKMLYTDYSEIDVTSTIPYVETPPYSTEEFARNRECNVNITTTVEISHFENDINNKPMAITM